MAFSNNVVSAPKTLKIENLITVDPITDNQGVAQRAWKQDELNLVLSGSAGTGKTFTALYLALESVMNKSTTWERVVIIRSIVPTREMGYIPGTVEEKLAPYTAPYASICSQLFEDKEAFDKLVGKGIINFESTSFIRGLTFDNSIIIVDEMQNLNFHELDSVITRIGNDSRIIFAGDYYQSDFKNSSDRNGIKKFIDILEFMKSFKIVEFNWADICRSGLVRDYIVSKEMYDKGNL